MRKSLSLAFFLALLSIPLLASYVPFPVSSGTQNVRAEYINTSGSSSCTSGTCGRQSKSAGITSVAFNSTGVYTLTFPAGTWSIPPTCTASAIGNSGVFCTTNGAPSTTTAVIVNCYTSGPIANANDNPSVICVGVR